MKYIKLFKTHTAYEAAESGLTLPNVSHCVEQEDAIVKVTINGNEVDYLDDLPQEYQNTYATVEFYISEDAKTISWHSDMEVPNDFKITIPEGIEDCTYLFSSSIPAELSLPSTFTGNTTYRILSLYNPNERASHFVKLTVNAAVPPLLGANSITWQTSSGYNNNYSNLIIYVPAASVDAYKAAPVWSNYADSIQAIS